MNLKVVDNVIKKIEDKFGKMTVTRGQDHVFVGMCIKFLKNSKVQICMKDYITERIEVFECVVEEITKCASTPEAYFFNKDEE